MPTPSHTPPVVPPSFARLFFVLAAGVGATTTLIGLGVRAPGVVIVVGIGLVLGFCGLVLHEVGRLLADETGA